MRFDINLKGSENLAGKVEVHIHVPEGYTGEHSCDCGCDCDEIKGDYFELSGLDCDCDDVEDTDNDEQGWFNENNYLAGFPVGADKCSGSLEKHMDEVVAVFKALAEIQAAYGSQCVKNLPNQLRNKVPKTLNVLSRVLDSSSSTFYFSFRDGDRAEIMSFVLKCGKHWNIVAFNVGFGYDLDSFWSDVILDYGTAAKSEYIYILRWLLDSLPIDYIGSEVYDSVLCFAESYLESDEDFRYPSSDEFFDATKSYNWRKMLRRMCSDLLARSIYYQRELI